MDIEDMSSAALLKEVNKAISTILIGGQSYRIGTMSLTRADLSKLYQMRKELSIQIQNEGDDELLGGTSVTFFDGR